MASFAENDIFIPDVYLMGKAPGFPRTAPRELSALGQPMRL